MGKSVPKNQKAALAFLETQRWPDGVPVCPHCRAKGGAFRISGRKTSKTPARHGLWKCGSCRSQFSVTVGTMFQESRIAMHKWLRAVQLLCSSEEGVTAYRLHRRLGITYKSAAFMAERIRYAMTTRPLSLKLTRGAALKPLSFAPLGYEEAVASLLKVAPRLKSDRLDALDRALAAYDKRLQAARQRARRRK